MPPPPRATPFPYTTLFRSEKDDREGHDEKRRRAARDRVDQRQIAGPVRCGEREDVRRLQETRQENHPPCDPAHAAERIHQERSEEHTSELQSHSDLVCRLL